MKAAKIHPKEQSRLKELQELKILDTAPEIDFDEITLLAGQICQTPIALISLVDETRQWFKSKQGLTASETPRQVAFCAHSILQEDTFVVPDATLDERFMDNPLVVGEPHVIFYAGSKILSPGGLPIGTVCVIDKVPRQLTEAQLKSLGALSSQVSKLLMLKKQLYLESKLREQIVASAKLATLGEMAGGVAHEINTPLAIVISKSDSLIEKHKKNQLSLADAVVEIEKIKSTSQRIARIVSGLRLFSRESKNDKKEVASIWAIIESTLELCREKIIQSEIKLSIHVETDSQVECRPAELSQVLMNLISNSVDAVSALSSKWIQVHSVKRENRVFLSVTDSGFGIESEVVEQMMNPFFTTKEVGKGTGLGLSISNGIIQAHGGSLYYDRECKNTRFVVELPAAKHSMQDAVT
jgi:two-component system NtrC family sensor kinase